MLVPNTELVKLGLVLVVEQVLENVLKLAVVGLENGVLRAHIQWHLLVDGNAEAGVRKARDRLGGVVHGHSHTTLLRVVKHINVDLLAVGVRRGVRDRELTGARHDKVLAAVLVTKCMTTDANGLRPARDRAGDFFEDDGLTEHGATENVADGTIR